MFGVKCVWSPLTFCCCSRPFDPRRCKKEAEYKCNVVVFGRIFQAEGENEVNNELANRISLFYADATPMLKALSDGTTKFVSEVRLTEGSGENLRRTREDIPSFPFRPFAEQELAHREHD